MKQNEATKERPFYSVSYEYARNPYTNYSFNRWFEITGDKTQSTMQGTDNLELAKKAANHLVKSPEIRFAYVSKSVDCYNHNEVFKAENPIYQVMIYDNGGKTADRYTALFPMFPAERDGSLYALGFNCEPFHPQGIGQHCSAAPGRHLGRRIQFDQLNADCQKLITQEFNLTTINS